MLGRETVWDDAIGLPYKRGSKPVVGDDPSLRRFETLVQDLTLTYERIQHWSEIERYA